MPPAGARKSRSCPTRWRRCSARCTSTAGRRSRSTWSSGCSPRPDAAVRPSTGSTTSRRCRSWSRTGTSTGPDYARAVDRAGPRQALPRHRQGRQAGRRRGRGAVEEVGRAGRRVGLRRVLSSTAELGCPSYPRSRRCGAGSTGSLVGRRVDRVEVGRERTVRRTSRQALDRRLDRLHDHGRQPPRQVPAASRSTPATR